MISKKTNTYNFHVLHLITFFLLVNSNLFSQQVVIEPIEGIYKNGEISYKYTLILNYKLKFLETQNKDTYAGIDLKIESFKINSVLLNDNDITASLRLNFPLEIQNPIINFETYDYYYNLRTGDSHYDVHKKYYGLKKQWGNNFNKIYINYAALNKINSPSPLELKVILKNSKIVGINPNDQIAQISKLIRNINDSNSSKSSYNENEEGYLEQEKNSATQTEIISDNELEKKNRSEKAYDQEVSRMEEDLKRKELQRKAINTTANETYNYIKSGARDGIFNGIRLSVSSRSNESEDKYSRALSATTYELGISIKKAGFYIGYGPAEAEYSGSTIIGGLFYDIFDWKIENTRKQVKSFLIFGLNAEYGLGDIENENSLLISENVNFYGIGATVRLLRFIYFSIGYGLLESEEVSTETIKFNDTYTKISGGLHFSF